VCVCVCVCVCVYVCVCEYVDQKWARRELRIVWCGICSIYYIYMVGQNRVHAPYMTVYLVIPLPNIPYIHHIYMVMANPTYLICKGEGMACARRVPKTRATSTLH